MLPKDQVDVFGRNRGHLGMIKYTPANMKPVSITKVPLHLAQQKSIYF